MPSARFGRLGSAAMILSIVLSKRLRASGELKRPDARRDETPQSRVRTCAVFGNRTLFHSHASQMRRVGVGSIAALRRP